MLEKERNSYTPILALTASVLTEEHSLFYQAGMDAIEFKPIDFGSLFSSMENLVPIENGHLNSKSQLVDQAKEEIDFSVLSKVADCDGALKNWCDPLVYANALRSFAGDHSEDAVIMMQLLKSDMTDESQQQAYEIAHALKGVSANLMLFDVMSGTARLNSQLKSSIPENIEESLQQLSQSLDVAVKAIHKLEIPESAPSEELQFDESAVNALLEQLVPAIERYNPDAVTPILDELSLYYGQTVLTEVRKQISLYDFDAAVIKANKLIEHLRADIGGADEKNNTNR